VVRASREHLVASDLPGLLRTVLAALAVARQEVDDLNVYPVPDGDTGTNLHATVQAAVDAVDALDTHADDVDLATAASRGALRGAAGNSGVIFSQVVRALAEHVARRPLGVTRLAGMLEQARTLAYDAVAEPVGGTILSALDAAHDAARRVEGDVGLATAVALVVEEVGESVAASRNVLEANRHAGVVDAGARGLEVALDGLLAYVEGRRFEAVPPPPVRRTHGEVVSRESGSSAYAHEVQYLLEAPDDVAPRIREALVELGDSVVVVACGGLLNVHVHTNDVDGAVAVGADYGEPMRVAVTTFDDEAPAAADEDAPVPRDRAPVGFLTVLPGTALVQLARGMGAIAIHGTAGALPTVATVLNAVGDVAADEVVLLPGHPALVPTMRQASAVSVAEGGRHLHVVEPAVSVPAVLAVLAVGVTRELDLDSLAATAGGVRAGEVVAAVRDADTPIGPVREGQWLALVGGIAVAASDDVTQALVAVVDHVVDGATELVTLVPGAGVDAAEQAVGRDHLARHHPDVEVEVVDGRQRPARWIVGAE
jgi:DAK2 domain fusion protein YloV